MAIVMILITAIVLAVPIFAAVVVSLASIREDRARSLGRKPRNATCALARCIVGFHAEGTVLQPRSRQATANQPRAARRLVGRSPSPAATTTSSPATIASSLPGTKERHAIQWPRCGADRSHRRQHQQISTGS
jgi:hypothetical protein